MSRPKPKRGKLRVQTIVPFRNVDLPLQCPKCKRRSLQLDEFPPMRPLRYRQAEDGLFEALGRGSADPDAGPGFVLACCETCDHAWRVRALTSVRALNSFRLRSRLRH